MKGLRSIRTMGALLAAALVVTTAAWAAPSPTPSPADRIRTITKELWDAHFDSISQYAMEEDPELIEECVQEYSMEDLEKYARLALERETLRAALPPVWDEAHALLRQDEGFRATLEEKLGSSTLADEAIEALRGFMRDEALDGFDASDPRALVRRAISSTQCELEPLEAPEELGFYSGTLVLGEPMLHRVTGALTPGATFVFDVEARARGFEACDCTGGIIELVGLDGLLLYTQWEAEDYTNVLPARAIARIPAGAKPGDKLRIKAVATYNGAFLFADGHIVPRTIERVYELTVE